MKDRIELAKYFHSLGFKVGAEIGVMEGSYSRALCKYNPNLYLYSIDGWDELEHEKERIDEQLWYFNRTKNKLAKWPVTIIKGKSLDIAKQFDDGELDFVYIDASHTYEDVMADILAWEPKVRKGGIVSGHDYQFPDVIKAVDEYALKNNIIINRTDCDKLNKKTQEPEYSWWYLKV